MKIRKTVIATTLSLLISSAMADSPVIHGGLVPGDTNGLYYDIGGGDVTALPYAPDNTDLNLNVIGNAGLHYNCGVFDPSASIVNSLNGAKSSFEQMTTQVFENGRGALLELPAYEIAQSLPDLYKLAQDGITNGRFDFDLGTKNCQEMGSEIMQGRNPYNDWATASIGDDWKYHMSLADTQAASSGLLGSTAGDINSVKHQVDQDNGKNGVQWVNGVSKNGQLYAGGQGQPLINLTSDTVIAGYNVLIGSNRSYNDKGAPASTPSDKRLVSAFATPVDAAKWVAKVVGEQQITTYSGGQKQSTPGIGLLNDVSQEAQTIKQQLVDMVRGNKPVNLKNLQAVSPPKVIINSATITMLRKQSSAGSNLMQTIYINKLAQEIAVARVIDKAKLGLQLLEVGSQVPSVYANHAAQVGIQADESRMQQWIGHLRNSPKDNEEFVGQTISRLMGASHASENAGVSIRPSQQTPPLMQDGAIKAES